MNEKICGAEYIARFLKDYDVTHVFYVLAILRKSLTFMEDLGIRRVSVHSEKSAAYMADGYARISNKPGIAMAQSVGAANLAAGLQDAFLGHSPVIAITGRKDFYAQYRNAYQEINHAAMFDAVTKYNVNVDKGRQLPNLLRQAFREVTSGSPRPAHLDLLGLSGDIIEDEIIEESVVREERFTKTPSIRINPDENELIKAVEILKKSKKPVIIGGRGAVLSGAGKEIFTLSEKLSIPLAFSCHAKGLIPDSYDLNAGTVGTYSCPCANQIVAEADLVFYIGSGIGDQVTFNWTIPCEEVRKIQIDIDPSELGKNYPNTFGILGDAKITVDKMLQIIGALPAKTGWAESSRQIINEWKEKRASVRNSDNFPIRPERLCKELSDQIPDNAVIVADTGYSAIWACSMIDFNSFNQIFLRSAGSLGWAFPASLGAKCAAPEKTIICFIGDGGFWYHIAELETACRLNLKTITIVNNNSAWGQSIEGIEKAYGDKRGNSKEVYTFKEVNFAEIARDIGCLGIRVEKPQDLKSAINKALNSDLPVVLDVVTDPSFKPEKAWKPGG